MDNLVAPTLQHWWKIRTWFLSASILLVGDSSSAVLSFTLRGVAGGLLEVPAAVTVRLEESRFQGVSLERLSLLLLFHRDHRASSSLLFSHILTTNRTDYFLAC